MNTCIQQDLKSISQIYPELTFLLSTLKQEINSEFSSQIELIKSNFSSKIAKSMIPKFIVDVELVLKEVQSNIDAHF